VILLVNFFCNCREETQALIEKASACVIDMSFDHLMQPREISSLALQIRHAYGYNKRALRPYKMYLTSLDEEKGPTCQVLKKDGGYDRWLMCKTVKHYVDVFGNKNVVYLTADSETVLETLDDNTTYIIGGLVDKNRYKGLCFEEAKKREVRTARLPIGKYLEGNSRKVVTVNQVFHMMLHFRETQDWEKSFLAVMPQRKGNTCRGDTKESCLCLHFTSHTS